MPKESCSRGVFRISNTDREIIDRVTGAMAGFDFRVVVGGSGTERPEESSVSSAASRSGSGSSTPPIPRSHRKRSIEGAALKSGAIRVVDIDDLGVEVPMYDITTGTGDFIADGVVSHNCFARPTHEYLGLDPSVDFDRVIVVKTNAVEKLRAELRPSRWGGHHIAMGTNTDPYQRAEGKYRLTRGIIEVLTEARNPFSILTKGTLVLARPRPARRGRASTPTSSSASRSARSTPRCGGLTEPGTPHPRLRIEAVAKLNEAGMPCGVLIAPILPGLSDTRRPARRGRWARASMRGPRSISPVAPPPATRGARALPRLALGGAPRADWPSHQPACTGGPTRRPRSASTCRHRVHGLIAEHRRRAGRRTVGPVSRVASIRHEAAHCDRGRPPRSTTRRRRRATMDVDRAEAITLTWEDGSTSSYPARGAPGELPLRGVPGAARAAASPCGRSRSRPSRLRIEGAELVGGWGITVTWNDGHSTGIFAWSILRTGPTCTPRARS